MQKDVTSTFKVKLDKAIWFIWFYLSLPHRHIHQSDLGSISQSRRHIVVYKSLVLSLQQKGVLRMILTLHSLTIPTEQNYYDSIFFILQMSHATVCKKFSETHSVSVTAFQQIVSPVGNSWGKAISWWSRDQTWTIALRGIT